MKKKAKKILLMFLCAALLIGCVPIDRLRHRGDDYRLFG